MTTMHRAPGWLLRVYGREHGIPHFHISCPDGQAVVAIDSLTVLAGHVPAAVLHEARAWAAVHGAELLAEWQQLNPRHPT